MVVYKGGQGQAKGGGFWQRHRLFIASSAVCVNELALDPRLESLVSLCLLYLKA